MSYRSHSRRASQKISDHSFSASSQPDFPKPIPNAAPHGKVALRVQEFQGGTNLQTTGDRPDINPKSHRTSLGFSHYVTNKSTEPIPHNKTSNEQLKSASSSLGASPKVKYVEEQTFPEVMGERASSTLSELERPQSHLLVLNHDSSAPWTHLQKTKSKLFLGDPADSASSELGSREIQNFLLNQSFNIPESASDITLSYKLGNDVHTEILESGSIAIAHHQTISETSDDYIKTYHDQASRKKKEKANETNQNFPNAAHTHSSVYKDTSINNSINDHPSDIYSGLPEMKKTVKSLRNDFESLVHEIKPKQGLQFENEKLRVKLDQPKPTLESHEFAKDKKFKSTDFLGLYISSPKKAASQEVPEIPRQNLKSFSPGLLHSLTKVASRVKDSPFFVREMTSTEISPSENAHFSNKQNISRLEDASILSSNSTKYINHGHYAPHLEHLQHGKSFYSSRPIQKSGPQNQNYKLSEKPHFDDRIRAELDPQYMPGRSQSQGSFRRKPITSTTNISDLSRNSTVTQATPQVRYLQKISVGSERAKTSLSQNKTKEHRLVKLQNSSSLGRSDKFHPFVEKQDSLPLKMQKKNVDVLVQGKAADKQEQIDENFDGGNDIYQLFLGESKPVSSDHSHQILRGKSSVQIAKQSPNFKVGQGHLEYDKAPEDPGKIRLETASIRSFLSSRNSVLPSISDTRFPEYYQNLALISSSSARVMKESNCSPVKNLKSDRTGIARRLSSFSMIELSGKDNKNYEYSKEFFDRDDSWSKKEKKERRQRLIIASQIKETFPPSFDNKLFKTLGTKTQYENPIILELKEVADKVPQGELLNLPHIVLAHHGLFWRYNLNSEGKISYSSHKVPLDVSSIKGIRVIFQLKGDEDIIFDTAPKND